MEQANLDQAVSNLKKIIGACIGFIVLIVVAIILDSIEALYKNNNAPYAVSLLVIFGIVMPVVIIILSSIGKINLKTNPKLIYGFSIGTLVMLALIIFALIYGAGADFSGIHDDIALGYPQALLLDATLGVLLAIAILPVVLIIVFAVKNLKIASPFVQQGMASPRISAATSSVGAAVLTGSSSSSTFCSKCGAPNNSDAKFCNKCGQAL